jgi:hypothetical protein
MVYAVNRIAQAREALVKIRLIFAVVAAVTLVAASCSSDSSEPADVISDYVAAYNSGDIDAVMTVFTEDSVVYGHPFSSESAGLTAIRSVQLTDLGSAASSDAYSFSNVEVNGDTVTWDSVWVNSQGETFCQKGQSAVVKDGKILAWTWPSDDSTCP